jgi:hypothetical protein
MELLSPLIGADARPGQQVRQLPAFVGIGDSGRSDISEHVDDLLAGASASSLTLRDPRRRECPEGEPMRTDIERRKATSADG